MATTAGTAPRERTHIRDGITLACLGVAGWGIAPLLNHPELALPSLAAGAVTGASAIPLGQRAARREQLVHYLSANLLPMLGTDSRVKNPVQVKGGWTHGWPGVPRRLRIKYGYGKIKLGADPESGLGTSATLVAKLGGDRWANEIAREVARLFGADYVIDGNDPVGALLTLKHRPDSQKPEEIPENPQVVRAKKLVNELLAGTASVRKVTVNDNTGEVTRLEVTHQVGAKLAASGYRNRVEKTISVMLPGRWRAKWDMEGDSVSFEVRPTLPESLWIPPLELPDSDPLKNYRDVRIAYGVDEDSEQIVWRPAVTPMWLITGSTGSGKTSTAHGILTQITQFGWPVWVADGKGIEFLGFQDWPNVQIIGSHIADQVALIHRAWQLMERRYQLVVQRKARTEDFEPLMLFVDEFTDLKANLLTWYSQIKVKGDPTKPPTLAEIGSIARKGRTARVHLVLSMQRPDADILTGEARENFGMRTSMGPLSPDGAEMMWNNSITGVTLPRGKIGRAIGVNSHGIPVEMQAYRVPDPKDAMPGTPEGELIAKLRPRESAHERLLIVPPETDWSTGEPIEPRFSDYAEADWVKAVDRPDLDPLAYAADSKDGTDPTADGRALSSTMALFGLEGNEKPDLSSLPTPSVADALRMRPAEERGGGTSPDLDIDLYAEGYGQQTTLQASNLSIGDLIRVDDELDAWAVLDEEPLEDFEDAGAVVLAWRDDQDNSGQLIVPADSAVPARRPLQLTS